MDFPMSAIDAGSIERISYGCSIWIGWICLDSLSALTSDLTDNSASHPIFSCMGFFLVLIGSRSFCTAHFFIPALKHLFNRHLRHLFLPSLLTSQFLLNRQ